MITVLFDPDGATKRVAVPVPDGTLLRDWILSNYGPNGFEVPTKVFIDRQAEECELDLESIIEDGYPISRHENIIIVHRPQGGFFIATLVLAIVAVALIDVPSVPLVQTPLTPEFKQPTESPNNSLSGQTNIVRPLQRIPDIFGKNLVFPDLIAKPYFEYVDHVKVQFEFMCIGRGEYFVTEEKTGDTLLGNIAGTVSQIFEPFTAPTGLVNVTVSNEVNGQDLFGPNIEKIDILSALTEFTASNTMKSTDGAMARFSEMVASEQFTVGSPSPVATMTGSCSFSGATITALTSNFKEFSVGDYFLIAATNFNNGNSIISAVSDTVMECIDPITGAPEAFTTETNNTNLTQQAPNSATVTFSSYSAAILAGGIIEHTIVVTGTPFSVTVASNSRFFTSSVFRDPIIGPFNVPGNPDEVWIDILGPRGIADLSGATPALLAINLEIRLQQVTSGGTPIGSVEKSNFNINEKTRDPRFYTVKVIPAVPGGLYTASVQRFTDTDDDPAIAEKTIWSRLAGVESISVTDFGNITAWFVQTEATEQAVKVQERKYNAIAVRKLPTYDRANDTMIGSTASGTHDAATSATVMTDSTATFIVDNFIDRTIHNTADGSQGVILSNTVTTITVAALHAGTNNNFQNGDKYDIYSLTARVADSVVQMITDKFAGNKPETQIDLVSLYDIQDPLDVDAIYGDKLGRFCYSFSNLRTSVADEIKTALKACRMFMYQEGNIIRFGRDQINNIRTTTFSRRVKKPDSETKSTKLFIAGDFDGITLDWTSEITGESETIVFPEGGAPSNPRRIEAAGVKNYEQAWNLANVEFNKLISRRTIVSTTVLRDGLLVSPNDRVGNVDSTTLSTQDGEVKGISGFNDRDIETVDVIDFEGNATATVILRDEDGSVSAPLTCTPRGDDVNGFILSAISPFPVLIKGDGDDNQMGTLYDFSPDSDHTVNDYLVQEIAPGADGYVDLKLINYTESIYDPDTTTPTPEA